jgi:hypothetical protein
MDYAEQRGPRKKYVPLGDEPDKRRKDNFQIRLVQLKTTVEEEWDCLDILNQFPINP